MQVGSQLFVTRTNVPCSPVQAPEGLEMSTEQQIALRALTQIQMARVDIMLREVGRASRVGSGATVVHVRGK